MSDLVERLEGAEAGSRELDGLIACLFSHDVESDDGDLWWGPWNEQATRVPGFTTSLDAALSLAGRVLGDDATPGVMLEQRLEGREIWGGWVDCKVGTTRFAATPALALCAAILRARQNTGEEG